MPTKRFYPSECDRRDTGSLPCAGGACSAPGGTPTFLSLSPMYALRRRARLTGRLPHGRLRKPIEPCYRLDPDSRWEESLPWRLAQLCTERTHSRKFLGEPYPKSQFRTLTRCGAQRTKKACECGDIDVDICVAYDPRLEYKDCRMPPCEPSICEQYTLKKCKKKHCRCAECKQEEEEEEYADEGEYADSTNGDYDDDDARCNSYGEKQLYNHACAGRSEAQLYKHACAGGSEAPRNINKENEVRWAQQRHAFRPSRARASNPSGRYEPISETMRGARQLFISAPVAAQSLANTRFRPRHRSRKFTGHGDPESFCNSTQCRFAGSNGPAEIRAAICAVGPQDRRV